MKLRRLAGLVGVVGALAAVVRRGVWRLCTDARMQGNCRDFGPGRYNDPGRPAAR